MRPADVYDEERDDADETRYSGRSCDRDELDRMAGISEPWHDLDPEGVMWP
jgi:hypothetical protein